MVARSAVAAVEVVAFQAMAAPGVAAVVVAAARGVMAGRGAAPATAITAAAVGEPDARVAMGARRERGAGRAGTAAGAAGEAMEIVGRVRAGAGAGRDVGE